MGYCTTFTANGITGQGQEPVGCCSPHISDSGTVRPWCIHLVDDGEVKVLLNHALRDVRGEFGDRAPPRAPGAGPQPSSAGWYCGGADGERGNETRLKAVAWSL